MDFLVYAIAYRLAIIAAGTVFMFFGYRLFIQGFATGEGAEIGGEHGGTKLWVKNAAPGTFFALFGAMLICLMVWQGNPEMNLTENTGLDVSRTLVMRGGSAKVESNFDLMATLNDPMSIDEQITGYASQLDEPSLSLGEASDPLLGLATAYLRDNRPEEAISLVRLVYQATGDRAETIALMAMVEHARGDVALARNVADRLSRLYPSRTDLINALNQDFLE